MSTISDKNSLGSGAVFTTLLQINIPNSDTLYVTNNGEDVIWNGNTYIPAPFEINTINEDTKGEAPILELSITNINRYIQRLVTEYDYLIKTQGATYSRLECFISVVNLKDLSNTTPILQVYGGLDDIRTDIKNVKFSFKGDALHSKEFPRHKVLKNFCRFTFKDSGCGYSGTAFTTCDNTLPACRERNNSVRFGGFVGVTGSGIVI